VRTESVMRVREINKIEIERDALITGMMWLIRVHMRLKNDSSSPDENVAAMNQLMTLIGPMESRIGDLSEQQGELWRAVLAVDGPELSSKEIAEERDEAANGEDWLDRTCKRVDENCPTEDGREEILMQLTELRVQLGRRKTALQQSQEEYRMAQAQILTARARLYEN
jgi:hypothetical protein